MTFFNAENEVGGVDISQSRVRAGKIFGVLIGVHFRDINSFDGGSGNTCLIPGFRVRIGHFFSTNTTSCCSWSLPLLIYKMKF